MIKQLALILTLLAAAFGAGWWVNGLHHDSVQLAVERAATAAGDKARTESQAISRESARKLEEQLESIANAAPKEIRTEIIKPVFTNVCVSPEFVSMYNDTAAKIGRTVSGKPVDQMPGNTAGTDGNNGK
ncbi:TPA: hypothetical protein RG672_000479 [Morganella morganii]|nr:hypothetical protein [Morganella morganii]